MVTYKQVVNTLFPEIRLVAPALTTRFGSKQPGDSIIVTLTHLQRSQPVTVISARVCRLLNLGQRHRPLDSVALQFVPATRRYTGKVEIPPNAQPGQLYRIEVSAYGTNGNIKRYLPGIEISR